MTSLLQRAGKGLTKETQGVLGVARMPVQGSLSASFPPPSSGGTLGFLRGLAQDGWPCPESPAACLGALRDGPALTSLTSHHSDLNCLLSLNPASFCLEDSSLLSLDSPNEVSWALSHCPDPSLPPLGLLPFLSTLVAPPPTTVQT